MRALTVAIALVMYSSLAALATSSTAGEPRSELSTEMVLGRSAVRGLGADRQQALDYLYGVEVVVNEVDIDPTAPLPVPEPPPQPYEPTPRIELGVLRIPAIGLEQPLFEGVTLTSINRGPAHWPGTAMPGELGNVVVAGHRTTYTRPFWALNELEPGDELIFEVDGATVVYELERIEIVHPDSLHIVDQTREHRATLFACHPRGSARQRIVGHFRLKPDTIVSHAPRPS